MRVSEFFLPDFQIAYKIPLAGSKISAGFPSPADDFQEALLDLNDELIKNPAATFFVRVCGESMNDVGIHNNDILIVDRSLEARDGKIVIAVINGELLVKRLLRKGESLWLIPENSGFPPIKVNEEDDFLIWGVVTSVVHKL